MIVTNENGETVVVKPTGEPVLISLDSKSLATLMAGGIVDVPTAGIRIQAGGDAARLIWAVRTKVHGGRVTQRPLPAKDC